MRLNHECIRSLLLYFEENLKVDSHGLNEGIHVKRIINEKDLSIYTPDDIYYTVSKLVEADFIIPRKNNISPRTMIIDEISWDGHEFLSSIRDDKVWDKAKKIIKDKGLPMVIDVVKQVVSVVIKETTQAAIKGIGGIS